MDYSAALSSLQALADGIDPVTGDEFPLGHLFQDARVTRALFVAIKAVERSAQLDRRKSGLPGNAGKMWSQAEEGEMVKLFDQGIGPKEIALKHGRTLGSIVARLVKLGKIDEEMWAGRR